MIFRFFFVLLLSTLLLSCMFRKTAPMLQTKDKSDHTEMNQLTKNNVKKPICFPNIDPVIKSGFSKTTSQKIQNRCQLIDKQVFKLKTAAKKELKNLAAKADTDSKDIADKTSSIIDRITSEINHIIASSILAQYIHKDNLKQLIKKYKSIVKKQLQNVASQMVNKKLKTDKGTDDTDSSQQEEKTEIVLADSKKLNRPDENLYTFQSPEGEFLDKSKTLYNSVWNKSPFYYKGIYAKNCGLAAIEVADQEFYQYRLTQAEMAYVAALAFMRIVFGDPLLEDSKYLYEFCTKRNYSSGMVIEDMKDITSYLTSTSFRELFESEKLLVITDYDIIATLEKIRERAFNTYLTTEEEEQPETTTAPENEPEETSSDSSNENTSETSPDEPEETSSDSPSENSETTPESEPADNPVSLLNEPLDENVPMQLFADLIVGEFPDEDLPETAPNKQKAPSAANSDSTYDNTQTSNTDSGRPNEPKQKDSTEYKSPRMCCANPFPAVGAI